VVTTTDEARGHPATTRAKRRGSAGGDSRRPGGLEPSRVGYLYVLPALAVYAAFVLVPLLHTVWLSFFDWDGITVGTWSGLENYVEVLRDEDLRAAFVHSLAFLGFTCALPVALGLVLAALLSRHQIRGLAFFRSVLFLPQVIAMVVVGVAWRWMYADDGAVNQLLRLVGLDGVTRAWLGDFDLALPAVGLVGTWVMYGLCMLLFLSGAQKIDRSLYEAARMDGAGPVREFFAVTLPGCARRSPSHSRSPPSMPCATSTSSTSRRTGARATPARCRPSRSTGWRSARARSAWPARSRWC
jgi:raffinose/stachyose/melibiose transport system permease protein